MGLSPYSGSIFVQPPLILLPFLIPKLLTSSPLFHYVWPRALFIILDLIVARIIFLLGEEVSKKASHDIKPSDSPDENDLFTKYQLSHFCAAM